MDGGQPGAQQQELRQRGWLIAPFVLWPFVLIFYPVGGAATIATAFAAEALANVMGLGAGGCVGSSCSFPPSLCVGWWCVSSSSGDSVAATT